MTRLNSQIPRPYVEARSNCCPPEAKMPSAVTATLGKDPGWLVPDSGPSSTQFGADVSGALRGQGLAGGGDAFDGRELAEEPFGISGVEQIGVESFDDVLER